MCSWAHTDVPRPDGLRSESLRVTLKMRLLHDHHHPSDLAKCTCTSPSDSLDETALCNPTLSLREMRGAGARRGAVVDIRDSPVKSVFLF